MEALYPGREREDSLVLDHHHHRRGERERAKRKSLDILFFIITSDKKYQVLNYSIFLRERQGRKKRKAGNM
jgi:hypothetical protein